MKKRTFIAGVVTGYIAACLINGNGGCSMKLPPNQTKIDYFNTAGATCDARGESPEVKTNHVKASWAYLMGVNHPSIEDALEWHERVNHKEIVDIIP